MKIGDRVVVKPRIWNDDTKEWTFEGNENGVHYGRVGTIIGIGPVNVMVKFLTNTTSGFWWFGFNHDELEPADENAELTVI